METKKKRGYRVSLHLDIWLGDFLCRPSVKQIEEVEILIGRSLV